MNAIESFMFAGALVFTFGLITYMVLKVFNYFINRTGEENEY